MRLFSFLRKNKQENASSEGEYYSRAEENAAPARGRSKRKSNQSDQPADPVLPEKKRARRRLIGAIALVLAAVIGLPMLLDSEPKPLSDDIAIEIPSKDAPADGRVRTTIADVPPIAALDQDEQIVEPSSLSNDSQDVKKTGADAKLPAAEKVESGAKSDDKAVLKAAPPKLVEPKPLSKIEANVVMPAKSDDSARAKAILEGRTVVPTAALKKPGTYVVQVAALASQEKISELRNKLKQAGFQDHTQKVATETGERTRIRLGPFASKEEAEKTQAKLGKIGLNGTIVPVGR